MKTQFQMKNQFQAARISVAAARRTAILWLRRFLLAVLGPFKDALLEVRVNSALLFSLLGKVAWLTPLVTFHHVFMTFPGFYHDFQEAGPEWAWGMVILFLIACDCAAMFRRVYEWQILCLILGAMFWLTLCKLVAAGVPHGFGGLPAAPTAGIYLFGGIGCLIGAYRLVHQHGARQEAMQFLLITKRIEAERATGVDWVDKKPEEKKAVATEKAPKEIMTQEIINKEIMPQEIMTKAAFLG